MRDDETIAFISKRHIQHPMLIGMAREFAVRLNFNWEIHSINFLNPSKTFKILCTSNSGPIVI